MDTRRGLSAALVIATLALAEASHAKVTVQFIAPERYVDADEGHDQERSLAALERHLKTLGEHCLKEGESLELKILDVDLAGRHEWWRTGYHDLRVMREITWPRVELDYTWRNAAGAVLGASHERVADMNYLWRSAQVRNDTESLPYERAMFRDWFERRFCGAVRRDG